MSKKTRKRHGQESNLDVKEPASDRSRLALNQTEKEELRVLVAARDFHENKFSNLADALKAHGHEKTDTREVLQLIQNHDSLNTFVCEFMVECYLDLSPNSRTEKQIASALSITVTALRKIRGTKKFETVYNEAFSGLSTTRIRAAAVREQFEEVLPDWFISLQNMLDPNNDVPASARMAAIKFVGERLDLGIQDNDASEAAKMKEFLKELGVEGAFNVNLTQNNINISAPDDYDMSEVLAPFSEEEPIDVEAQDVEEEKNSP